MDGCTKVTCSHSGPIGLLLKNCEKNPVVKFDQIGCTLQPLDLKDIKKLSTDQQYLYRTCLAIKNVSCSSSVTDNSEGKLSHARRLISASRLLQLYIGTPSPSQNLIILVKATYYNAYKDKDLKEMCKQEQFPALTLEEFPCHTRSVERCVKLIFEAAMKVCNETARDGYICAKFQARKELPTLHNKGQYYSNT
ncbi:hypothetical protein AVEN_206143-1 [Araneus ventricosus]|uniref:Uncharacterized protein n=1 Tax=Araneus ventricosus TaxID=182803 RepID=A0A4Y2M0N5_ARAVE|nr:hypothetical protein AVEN_206143-1 [Araneus ventricosus]